MADASILTNIGDRVRVKEKAREFGLGILQEIPKILRHISNSSHKQDVRDWEINLRKSVFYHLLGFANFLLSKFEAYISVSGNSCRRPRRNRSREKLPTQ